MMRSLYVHIPFCREICSYCDFCKVYYKQQWVDDYLIQLKKELEDKHLPFSLYTIYIGGGTPTSLTVHQLKYLMDTLKPYTYKVKEYTIEVNPETVDEEKLKILFDGGITRLSIGVQTFQEKLLKPINRKHKNKDVFKIIQQAKKIGFQNISIDLMYGIPYQTQNDIIQDLNILKTLDIQHVSYYSLILEDNTILSFQNYQPIDEQEEAEIYEYIQQSLDEIGFHKYEVSNFAQEGYESLHNKVYWHYGDYDGVGLGAHGIVQGIRYENTRSLTSYLQGHYLKEQENIDVEDQMFEMIMMGLRLVEGVSLERFYQCFHKNIFDVYEVAISKHCDLGLLVCENGYLKTTVQGMELLHEILIDFL